MTTTATITQLGLPSNPDYRLCLRSRVSGVDLFSWSTFDGRVMDYVLARKMLLGVERLLPALHRPGATLYLIAEPIRSVKL